MTLQTDVRTDGRKDGRADGRTGGRTEGRPDGRGYNNIFTFSSKSNVIIIIMPYYHVARI